MRHLFLKHLLLFVCSFIFLLSHGYSSTDFEKEIDQLSNKIAEKIAVSGKKKIAVVDFTDIDGSITELGRFTAEEFSTSLAGSKKEFIVVDRFHLKTILKEHKLSSTGLIDQNTARQLGKLAGVDALVTGTLTPLGESVRINVKVLDIETAAVIDAKRGNIAMTDAIKSLLNREIGFNESQGSPRTIKRIEVKSIQKVEEQNFVFEILGCKMSGKTITFSLLITNKEKDRKFAIGVGNTRLFDDFGNEYVAQKIKVGNEITNCCWTLSKVLFSNVPTKTFLTFHEVSPQASMALALVLDCGGERDGGWREFIIKFRGIPFSK